jgi:predicted Zn finger-like uncharacterized protein
VLTTNCPSCSTAFRVTPEQLKARAGKVRCGHCQAVFNALESLNDLPPALSETETGGPAATEAPPAAQPPAETAVEATLQDTSAETIDTSSIDILLEDVAEEPARPSRGKAVAWGLAATLALCLAVVQFGYHLRAELAISQPDLRPLLESLCDLLDCDIPLPHKAELVSIEASDLHPDPQRKALLVLAAALKNRAPFAQAYPHLELTLTDTQDQPMLRKVLAPSEYLAPGTDERAGFAANGDLAVGLWIEAVPGASGYRLYLFYP